MHQNTKISYQKKLNKQRLERVIDLHKNIQFKEINSLLAQSKMYWLRNSLKCLPNVGQEGSDSNKWVIFKKAMVEVNDMVRVLIYLIPKGISPKGKN